MRSSVMRSSSVSIAAALLRRSPPRLPSVVDEASSNCPRQYAASAVDARRCRGRAARCTPPWSDASQRSSRSRRKRARACNRLRRYRRCSHPHRRTHLESPRPGGARRARQRSLRPARRIRGRLRRHAWRQRPQRVRRAPPDFLPAPKGCRPRAGSGPGRGPRKRNVWSPAARSSMHSQMPHPSMIYSESRFPPRIKSGAGFCRIMPLVCCSRSR
jgi:hypothetical protein